MIEATNSSKGPVNVAILHSAAPHNTVTFVKYVLFSI